MNSAVPSAPIEYPTLTIGGISYKLRLSLSASYLLELAKVDPSQLAEAFKNGGRNIELMVKLCAAMMGNYDARGNWHSVGMDPLKLADLVPMEEFKALTDAVLAALVKAPPEGTTAQTQPANPMGQPN